MGSLKEENEDGRCNGSGGRSEAEILVLSSQIRGGTLAEGRGKRDRTSRGDGKSLVC